MNKETIRAIDVLAGRIICGALTLHRRFFDLFRKKRSEPPKRILFLKLIEQGATVLAYGALLRAVELVGKENVYFCVFQENRDILDLLEVVPRENVIAMRHKKLSIFAWDALRAIARFRRLRIDATVDMEFFARAPTVLAYLSGARIRVGLHRFTAEAPYRGDLMTHRVGHNPYLHVSQAYLALVEALVQDPKDTPLPKVPIASLQVKVPRLNATEQERTEVRQILEDAAGRKITGPVVLLNPNTSDLLPIRRWPTDRFVALGKKIQAEHPNATVVLIGAPSERAQGEVVAKEIGPGTVCVAGRTTLRQAIVLYGLSDILVTNDSGPGHFAAMTDIDCVVLFGPESPKVFGGLGPRVQILYAALACSPCVSVYNHRFSPCSNAVCMQAHTVDSVYAAVRELLQKRTQAAS